MCFCKEILLESFLLLDSWENMIIEILGKDPVTIIVHNYHPLHNVQSWFLITSQVNLTLYRCKNYAIFSITKLNKVFHILTNVKTN